LVVAIEGGAADCLAFLLSQHGVDTTWMPNGTTPLMMAAALCRPDMVAMLLQAGANPTLQDNQGCTALAYAEEGHAQHQDAPPETQAHHDQCIDLLINAVRAWTVRMRP